MVSHDVSSISTILFDLGGVLFQLSGAGMVCEWTEDDLTPQELVDKWLASPAVRAFESGHIDFPVFREQLKTELKLSVDDETFTSVFTGWIAGLFPGARDLLEKLSSRYHLACFSNTNHIHWEIMGRDYRVLDCFDTIFASFEMGMVKPDKAAFDHVIEQLNVPAETIVFLDDNQINVDGARACGMKSRRVYGVDGVVEALEYCGLM